MGWQESSLQSSRRSGLLSSRRLAVGVQLVHMLSVVTAKRSDIVWPALGVPMLFTLSDKSLRPTDSRNRHPNSMTSTSKDASPSPNTSIPNWWCGETGRTGGVRSERPGTGSRGERAGAGCGGRVPGTSGRQERCLRAAESRGRRPYPQGVGLFFDDVCHLADASDEQAGILEYRRVDPLVAEPLRQLLRFATPRIASSPAGQARTSTVPLGRLK